MSQDETVVEAKETTEEVQEVAVVVEEVESEHDSEDMPEAAVDKHAGHYGPELTQEGCRL